MINVLNDIKIPDKNNFINKINFYRKLIGLETILWISALIYLAFFVNPFETHFTICPLSNLGFEHCPGCGLGNAIALIFQGEFSQSFTAHILGIPALIIILHRIYSIIKFNLIKVQTPTL